MSNVPLDLQGASRFNLFGNDDGFPEYQERLHTLIAQQMKDSEGYAGHCCDEGHNENYSINNSECQGY